MPQIQYSEKYYDDVYEYRCARAPTRLFPGARAGTGDLADARILRFAREGPWGFSPRRDVAGWAAERRVRASRRPARGSSVDETSFESVWRSEDLDPPPRGAHRAGFPRAREIEVLPLVRHRRATDGPFLPATLARIRHVVLPPDIAKLLPKGRLLSEVRRARHPPFDRPAAPGLRPPRASRLPAISRHVLHRWWSFQGFASTRDRSREPPSRPFARVSRGILTLPIPSSTQAEWRGLGVQQSRGWVHYAIHRPEPHIMLYRCARRPPRPTHAARFSRALFQTSGRRDLARRASDPRPFHPDTRSRARSRFPGRPRRPAPPPRALPRRIPPAPATLPSTQNYPHSTHRLRAHPPRSPPPPDSPGARSTTASPLSPTPPIR